MNESFWLQQTKDKPLFNELIWSKPEHRSARGKLLIIGGNLHGFSAPAEAYTVANEAGAGTIRVLLPQAIHKIFRAFAGPTLETEFAASNPSGSFSQMALGEWLEQAMWADAVLLAGDLGRNSETAIIIEKYIASAKTHTTFTKDCADYFIPLANNFTHREDITLVVSMAQLQKLAVAVHFDKPFKLGTDLVQLTQLLHEFSAKYPFSIVVKQHDTVLVAYKGRVSTTPLEDSDEIWRVKTAAKVCVWNMQHPGKTFEALTTSLII